jgi:TonB family protein
LHTAALQLASIVAWPLLPLWIASARVRALIELAADERALEGSSLTARRQYGEVLLLLADGDLAESRFAFVPSFGSGLRDRVRALGFSRRWPLALQATLVALVGAAVFACAGEPETPAPANRPRVPKSDPGALPRAPEPPTRSRPDTIPGQEIVRGSLDPQIIRRIVRRHLNEVKWCYEEALASNPALAGRIVVQFTIGPTGQVESSVLDSSAVNNPTVESCVVTAVRRWQFPKPIGGGTVLVQYPFVLTPGH